MLEALRLHRQAQSFIRYLMHTDDDIMKMSGITFQKMMGSLHVRPMAVNARSVYEEWKEAQIQAQQRQEAQLVDLGRQLADMLCVIGLGAIAVLPFIDMSNKALVIGSIVGLGAFLEWYSRREMRRMKARHVLQNLQRRIGVNDADS